MARILSLVTQHAPPPPPPRIKIFSIKARPLQQSQWGGEGDSPLKPWLRKLHGSLIKPFAIIVMLLSKTVYKQMVPISKSFKLQKGQVTAFIFLK